jgi:hypothetical protein
MSSMRRLLVSFALLLVGAAHAAVAQLRPPDDSLKLAAEVSGRNFCAGGGGVDFLHLRLRLRYTNTAKRRLILYRGSNLFFQVVVSPGGEAARGSSKYELRTTSAFFLTREAERLERESPGKDFVTLAPGASHQPPEVTVSLPVARGGAERAAGTIAPGEHVLRLVVSTWYESKQLGERLRERWRRGGELWTAAVVTQPVSFEAGGASSPHDCASPAGKSH